jgi:hypothetical protein
MPFEKLDCLLGKTRHAAYWSLELLQKMIRQECDIVTTLAQRGQINVDHR